MREIIGTGRQHPGWDLHELRHSGLTHLGEAGASLLALIVKSRHRKAEIPPHDLHAEPF